MTAHASESILTPDFAKSLVRRVTSRTGSAVLDDDLVQEALLRGLIAFRRNVHVEYPRAFFSKIVRDTVRDHWRRRRSFHSLESVREIDLGYVVDYEQKLDRDRQLSHIHYALNMLPLRQRQLMVLHYVEGIPLGELSPLLGRSRSALKMALLRNRIRIRQIMTAQRDKSIRRIESY